MAAIPEDDEFYSELARPPRARGRVVRSSGDVTRIAKLEAALAPFARMSGSYTHMHGAHVIASRGGTILDVNDLRRAAALVPDAVV